MKYFQNVLVRTHMHYGIAANDTSQTADYTHYHDCYELYYLEQGKLVFTINGTNYLLHAGDMIFLPPYTLHNTKKLELPPPHKRTVIYFDDTFCEPFKRVPDRLLSLFEHENLVLTLDQTDQKKMSKLIELMTYEQDKRGKCWLSNSTWLLGEALVMAYRASSNQQQSKMKALPPSRNPKITTALQYIEANFHSKLTLEDVASKIYIHPTYFCRLFKEEIGVSFITYVNTIRMEYAKRQLAKSKMSIKEIGELSGFESDSAFCRTFKTFTGISPSDYRKKSKSMIPPKNH